MRIMRIIRRLLTSVLVVCVYFETGVCTAVSMFLIFCAIEVLPLRGDKK